MDEKLARRLSRQLRIVNVFLVLFTLLFIAGFTVAGFFIYRVYNYAQGLEQKANKTLDLQQQLCQNKAITTFLSGSKSLCSTNR